MGKKETWDYTGWVVLLFAAIGEAALFYVKQDSIDVSIIVQCVIYVCYLPIYAFMLIVVSLLPGVVLNALGIFNKHPWVLLISTYTIGLASLILLFCM
jgi:hypothetical protein